MTLTELFILLLIAGVCGSVATSLSGFSGVGCLGSIVLGFVGAMAGGWMSRQMNLPEPLPLAVGTGTFPIVWSILGAVVFTVILGYLRRGGRGEVV